MNTVNDIKMSMWGTTVGYLHREGSGLIGFQYDRDFLDSGIEISPVMMPLSERTYLFPALPEVTYHGLPGLAADSLPDKFGTAVISRWLESQGRNPESVTPLERLCYTGKRGMGALEYEPEADIEFSDEPVDIKALTELAEEILSYKEQKHLIKNERLMSQLMESGSSAGGARAKTLIAWNAETNDIRSGQVDAGPGYDYWLLKFDKIKNNRDKDTDSDEPEYTKIEYAYYLMALGSGIKMNECRLYEENDSFHFMTKRFDRIEETGEKIHMQSLCAIAHMDFNTPRVYSYEGAFEVMRRLHLSYDDSTQLFRRMVFNEYAKNYDDHTKNISFLMDELGKWSLAPAYDLTFSYKPASIWVNSHQMTINGKASEIEDDDLIAAAVGASIKRSDAVSIIDQVKNAVNNWETYAQTAFVSENNADKISKQLRIYK